jgi:uncharacterized YigZ family protein
MNFQTVKKRVRKEQSIKKSRFIATLLPVSSLDDVKKKIHDIKKEFKGATHHPYAFRIGHRRVIEKSSDNGEPLKSSGYPILQEIKRMNITNVLIVVTRFFGGIKLGLGGLSRAYRTSAKLLLESAEKVPSLPLSRIEIHVKNEIAGKIPNILTQFNAKILSEAYGERVMYRFEILEDLERECIEKLKNMTRGSIKIKVENV